jgi:hypothetical protein
MAIRFCVAGHCAWLFPWPSPTWREMALIDGGRWNLLAVLFFRPSFETACFFWLLGRVSRRGRRCPQHYPAHSRYRERARCIE